TRRPTYTTEARRTNTPPRRRNAPGGPSTRLVVVRGAADPRREVSDERAPHLARRKVSAGKSTPAPERTRTTVVMRAWSGSELNCPDFNGVKASSATFP